MVPSISWGLRRGLRIPWSRAGPTLCLFGGPRCDIDHSGLATGPAATTNHGCAIDGLDVDSADDVQGGDRHCTPQGGSLLELNIRLSGG